MLFKVSEDIQGKNNKHNATVKKLKEIKCNLPVTETIHYKPHPGQHSAPTKQADVGKRLTHVWLRIQC